MEPAPNAPESFTDQGSVAAYAKEAVETMRKTGLFAGKDGGSFCPQATATRAETATVCMRLGLKLGKVPAAATLTFYEGDTRVEKKVVTLSEEDTAALFLLLNDSSWTYLGYYAEHSPTHTLSFWCGKYCFRVLDVSSIDIDEVNYVSGHYFGGIYGPREGLIQEIFDIFEAYAD